MTALQKEVYRSLLGNNLEMIANLTSGKKTANKAKGKLNNLLMELRK